MERGLETRDINIQEIEEEEEEEEEEEDEVICRICLSPCDSENPLQYPCACSGSMKFVHPKCLLQWMKQQITFQCEVCKHKYSVHRVYAEDTPTRLPLREFVGGIGMKAFHVVRFCLRICVSCFYQILMVPFLAFWTWRLSFMRSLPEAKELVHSHMSPSTIMMDWLYGLVIGNILFVIGFFIFGFIREDEAHIAIAPAPGDENENHNADEIGEDAREPQAIAAANYNGVAVGLLWLLVFLRCVLRLMSVIFRFNDPVRTTCIYLVMCTIYFLFCNGVLIAVPFSLGRIIMHSLSWLSLPFIESALYIGNNLLKNASYAVPSLSTEIQNDGLLSRAIRVVAETLTANSTGPGQSLSSDGKPLLVYRSSGLYDVITLATGYLVVVSLVFVCRGIPIRTVASKIYYYLRKFQTTMIYPFRLIIHLGVLPSVYGWWLDVCALAMLGKSISQRLDFFSKFPLLSSSMHWTAGIIYMFLIHISTSRRRVLRKEVLSFVQYLADPICIILHVLFGDVQASRFLFSIAVNCTLIVFQVYIPIVVAMRLSPTIFPLHISVSDPFIEIPVVMCLLQIYLSCAIELLETFEALLHQWVTAVCCVLGLSGLLCSRPEDIGGQENVKVENYASDAIDIDLPLVLRVLLLVVMAWITWLVFFSSLIIVSLPLGRVLFSSISDLPITHGIKCNDLYAFFIGNFSIWTSFTGVRFFIEHFKAGKAHLRFSEICKLFSIIAKSCVLLSLWIVVIPVLIGLLFEFSFMVPIQAMGVEEGPVLLLCQEWAVGFFLFKVWRILVLQNHMIVLVDESWRIKLERVRENDFLKLPGRWMLQEILIPILVNLLMSLCFPYVLARWIVPSLGFSHAVNSTVYRFSWAAYVTIIVLFSCAKRFPAWITNLHNSIRDDRYSSLGLQNFGEVAME